MTIEGVLLDLEGVLMISWEPLPGAAEAVGWLRERKTPLRVVTNTTTHTCRDLAGVLTDAGITVEPGEIMTAVVGTAAYLRGHHAGARCFLLSDGDAGEDLAGVTLVGPEAEDADVVVVGGAGDGFDYASVNRAFRLVMDGAPLVAMHKNMYWMTGEGLSLDGGAYVRAIEETAGIEATVCGKPSRQFFEAALEMLDLPAERVCMVGDDIVNDVLGAQAVGLTGVLVRTGKFRPGDLERSPGAPDYAIDSVGDLPSLLATVVG